MCSHPEHRVEVLPDGQIDEAHVFSYETLVGLLEKVRLAGYAHSFPQEVTFDGQSWSSS